MVHSAVTETNWSRVGEFITENMGLHFPPERRQDLQRGLKAATEEFGMEDVATCVDWLLSTPLSTAQLQVLASHLTVGETYFFREQKTLDALAGIILPKLIHSRRGRDQQLRIWSAACCTGEEPYSLAMMLHQLIPDLQEWRISILATDINTRFLQKASGGVYGEWSFRATPPMFKDRYFHREEKGRYSILPEIKHLVTFAHLNLVDHVFPSLTTNTNAMDLIFCRNVLMYFTPPQAQKVIQRLHHSLIKDGWLAVSPTEGTQATFSQFVPVSFPGTVLYQKGDLRERDKRLWTPAPVEEAKETFTFSFEALVTPVPPLPAAPPSPAPAPVVEATPPLPLAVAAELYQQGRYADAVETLLATVVEGAPLDPQVLSLLTRSLANHGRLADALVWSERWVAASKLDSASHYLRAVVLQELGDAEQARRSLQRSIYLHPEFVLAHFALGNLARHGGRREEADRHYQNALNLLRGAPPEELLPESDGLTNGRLMEIISSILEIEVTDEG